MSTEYDGIAMDCNRNAGSREGLPPFEGAEAASNSESHVVAPSGRLLGDKLIANKPCSVGFNNGACRSNFNGHRDYAGW
jgi:hypothetical protein